MREEILERAELQLMTGGFAKLNFGTIAKELETTRANIHYHFKNKESLAVEITEKYGHTAIDHFNSLSESFNDDFFGFFGAVEKMFWEMAECSGSTGCCIATKLATEQDVPEQLQELTQAFYKKHEQILIDVIQKAVDKGEIREDIDARREGIRVHVLMFGIMTRGQYIVDPKDAKKEMSGLLMDWATSLK
ncbi:MAG: TetR/AcrR family transcriptional regulator [Fibrobacterales bacterium]